jgi:hypothetical protein
LLQESGNFFGCKKLAQLYYKKMKNLEHKLVKTLFPRIWKKKTKKRKKRRESKNFLFDVKTCKTLIHFFLC